MREPLGLDLVWRIRTELRTSTLTAVGPARKPSALFSRDLDRMHTAVGRTHEPAQEAVGAARTAVLTLSPCYHPPCAPSTLRVGAGLTPHPHPAAPGESLSEET